MPATRTLLLFSGGIAVVLISFVMTTYLLNRLSPGSDLPNSPSVLAPLTQSKAGQNLLWPSEDFANQKWTRYQIAAIEAAAAIAPDGQNAASRLVESSDDGRHFIAIGVSGATPGAVHTFSVYFKSNARSIQLEIGDSLPGKYGTAACNAPNTGADASVTKNGDIVDGAVEDVGNGWHRCWAAMPFALGNVVLGIELRGQNGALFYKGDGQSGELIWGAQFEPGSRPTAYVSTSVGQVTKGN
jgi:hypothetical protein